MNVSETPPYTDSPTSYSWQEAGSYRSAQQVIPLLKQLMPINSVLDVGCSVGDWLTAFREFGVEDIQGVDGDHVDRTRLRIPEQRFHVHNLEQPLDLGRRFDLVTSLEVAEHVSTENADTYVDTLVRHGEVILLSAAIPFQGGKHHVNEQWPTYWVRKFQERDYTVIDPIRGVVWNNEDVDWWYAQNMLIYAKTDALVRNPALQREIARTNIYQLNLVHPKNYYDIVTTCPSETFQQRRYSE